MLPSRTTGPDGEITPCFGSHNDTRCAASAELPRSTQGAKVLVMRTWRTAVRTSAAPACGRLVTIGPNWRSLFCTPRDMGVRAWRRYAARSRPRPGNHHQEGRKHVIS
jgi:hypothetical protein